MLGTRYPSCMPFAHEYQILWLLANWRGLRHPATIETLINQTRLLAIGQACQAMSGFVHLPPCLHLVTDVQVILTNAVE